MVSKSWVVTKTFFIITTIGGSCPEGSNIITVGYTGEVGGGRLKAKEGTCETTGDFRGKVLM